MKHSRKRIFGGTVVPSPALAGAVKRLIDDLGEFAAVELLKISRISAARLAAQLTVRRATAFAAASVLGIAEEVRRVG